ncbi:MAG: hypothetical protein ACR2RF_18600 [Geminicoccaceae bacterium]
MTSTRTAETREPPARQPADWVSAQEAADMLRIAVATFLRKVDEGLLPAPSLVLGRRNPRWNIKLLYDAMARIESEAPVTHSDISTRIEEMAL